jgi:thiol-disulfide isomerase/thioredoxin
MKKLSMLALLTVIAITAVSQKEPEKTVKIRGKVTGNNKGYSKMFYYSQNRDIDSVSIVDGAFTIVRPATEPHLEFIYSEYEVEVKRRYEPLELFVDPSGDITIAYDISEPISNAKVSGTKSTVLYTSFMTQRDGALKKAHKDATKFMAKRHKKTSPQQHDSVPDGGKFERTVTVGGGEGDMPDDGPPAGAERVRATGSFMGDDDGPMSEEDQFFEEKALMVDSLFKKNMSPVILKFVKSNADLEVAGAVLKGMGRMLPLDELNKGYLLLSDRMKKSADGQSMASYIAGLKNAKVGLKVTNFVLTSAEGKQFNFEQLKGKYVWIDFWASWCGPCKQAFPYMRELYSKYKGKNLEILAISADSNKEPWLEAVKEFNNPWPQVWDNKNVANQFAVSAFPTSFLIGPDGTILIKEVGFERGGAFESKLKELFGN